jgi:hypothetical protein
MNLVTQLPRHPSSRDILNDNGSLEIVSAIRLLKIDASPRGSKSNSSALTDAFVTAYRDAVPSVTVDVMNVWDERLPEFDSAEAFRANNKLPSLKYEQTARGQPNLASRLGTRFSRRSRVSSSRSVLVSPSLADPHRARSVSPICGWHWPRPRTRAPAPRSGASSPLWSAQP